MGKLYNQLSKSYNKLFVENIIEFQRAYKDSGYNESDFVTFYPSLGIKEGEPCDFLIIGQAVNGWSSCFNTHQKYEHKILLDDASKASNSYYEALNYSPLDWVNVYWTKNLFKQHIEDSGKKHFFSEGTYYCYRSFFWNAAFKLICDYYDGLNRDSWEWSKRMVWSNLYKIAPYDNNPRGIEIDFQKEISIQLIQKEIEELKPKYCIVLTNGDWWVPFREKLKTQRISVSENFDKIVFHEKYHETEVFVTTRPPIGNAEEHVRQLLELIKK
jgi:hypothetical protein